MIYLIASSKYIKIGYSSNFKKRSEQYKTCNPDFKVLDIYEEGTEQDETNLHNILYEYSYKGEWMHYNDEVIKVWNNYTKHSINTLEKIKASEYELELTKYIDRTVKAELDKKSTMYELYFVLNNIRNCYYRNQSDLYNYIEKIVEEYYPNDNPNIEELIKDSKNLIKEWELFTEYKELQEKHLELIKQLETVEERLEQLQKIIN